MTECGETPDLKSNWRGRLGGILRLVICVVAVLWLYEHTDWQNVRKVLATADWRLALLGLLIFGPAPVLIGVRLKWLLAVHDVHLTLWQALKVTFVSNFLIHALPVGTSGGDAVKAWYIARDTPHKHEAVTSVFFDRVIGVAGLVLLSGFMVLINWNSPALAAWGRAIGLLVAGLALGAGLYFSHRFRRLLRLEQIIARLPFAGHLHRIDQAVFEFRNRKRRVVACIALAILLQVWSVVSIFFAGWALGIVGDQPWKALPIYLAYGPICFLSGALPLGVMELTYGQLFSEAAGLGTLEAAISLSLMTRLIQLLWALPGGIAMLTGRFSVNPPAAVLEDSPSASFDRESQTRPQAEVRL